MQEKVKFELSETHARILEAKRKIPADISVEMGLVSRDQDQIGFEYKMDGKCEFTKILRVTYRPDGTREKSFRIDPSGAKLFPFNLDCLSGWSRPQDVLIITEGEFDACSAVAAGEVFAISVPNGANRDKVGTDAIDPLNDGGFAWIWDGPRLLPKINCFEKIILAVDDDEKGHVLREELAARLGKQRCWWPTYPEGCKDLNDVLVRFGESGVVDTLQKSTRLVRDKLVSFRDLPESKVITEYSTGWNIDAKNGMDNYMRINVPELMVIVGRPGSGKSTWSLALAARLAELHDMPGAILQFEDQPRRNYEELVQFRLRTTGRYATETPGYRWPPSDEDRAKSEIWVDQMFRTVKPAGVTEDEDDYTFQWLRDAIWEAVKIHGAMWVLVDPWSEIEHVWSVNESETRYTNEALRQMKRMARQYNILLIVVVHPTKQSGMQKAIEDMTLYDTSGSAAWKNKADHGVIVYREEGADKDVLIKIDKCKNHRTMGVPGTVRMQYLKDFCDFRFVGEYVALAPQE